MSLEKEVDEDGGPFGGSGSTLIASEQLSRRCYLLEKNPKHCELIIRRYKKQGKGDVKKVT